jgi:hypothetical protein
LATDPNEWDLPPNPTWMRWWTYNYCVQHYGVYQDILDFGVGGLVAKLKGFRLMQAAPRKFEISWLTSLPSQEALAHPTITPTCVAPRFSRLLCWACPSAR